MLKLKTKPQVVSLARAQLIREADFGRPDAGDGVVEDVEVVFVSAIAIRGVVVIVDGHARIPVISPFSSTALITGSKMLIPCRSWAGRGRPLAR